MYWPARRREALNMYAIYNFHPMFKGAGFPFWYPNLTDGEFNMQNFGRSALEGGDVMPIGNKTVLIGMSERTQGSMIEQIADALFTTGSAERVIACVMTKDRAHMHLDTVFTFLDRDKVTIFPKVVGADPGHQPASGQESPVISTSPARRTCSPPWRMPSVCRRLTVVETGGDQYQREREQWDDANNTVALEPGVIISYERNTHTIAKMRAGGCGGHHHPRLRARQGTRRRTLHDLPHPA